MNWLIVVTCWCMQEMVAYCSGNNMGVAAGFISKEPSMVMVGLQAHTASCERTTDSMPAA